MKIFTTLALTILLLDMSFGQHELLPLASDIGNPKLEGSSVYEPSDQIYSLKGAGYNIWFDRDEFHYRYNRITGDFLLTANLKFIGAGVDAHRKIGWMVRESTDENARHVSATLHGDGLTVLQWRPIQGASMRDPEDQVFAPKLKYDILQLERLGSEFIMRAAMFGEPLQEIGRITMALPDEVLAGLFICSHNPEVIEEAQAWNVRVEKTVPNTYNGGSQGWLSSRLEIINAFSGERKIIHSDPGRFEAPNWMPDGKQLLFNQNGSLYTINTDGKNIQKFNTGFADQNNNDHGITFDGKMLAISHNPGDGSTVYVLPIEGGEPQLVTEKKPSYWHGWSADGKDVVYVATREQDNYDIYKKSIDGGEEIRLTDYAGAHADGCEYSPDGKYIYYNASPTGTMQIWRMKPDGSEKEQVTFDQYNDWFPHISPDGKWIAFISFPTTIDPKSHPTYKRVMLRLMPAAGGPPKVIGYLYGGQGTINVPSWSPDSKHFAFVSYSKE